MPRPTIREIAASADVSIATVSRALSKPELVAAETREHVQQVARELGYRAPRPLRGAAPRTIGLLVPDLENPFFGLIAKGVQSRARSQDLLVVVADVEEDAMIERVMATAMAGRVDGLILCSPRGTDQTLREVASRLPTVLANRQVAGIPSVLFDEEHGITASLRHLISLGHRRIAYAGGPQVSWTHRRRAEAFRRFAPRADGIDLIDLGSFPPYLRSGHGAADQALAAGVTAVVAFNDLLALGIIDRLIQRGVGVPEDLSVSGIDNVASATYVRPHLTTVNASRVPMGRAAVDLLTGVLRRDRSPVPQILPTELIVRDSTGRPPAASAVLAPHPAPPSRRSTSTPSTLAR